MSDKEVIYGRHAVNMLLITHPEMIKTLYLQGDKHVELLSLANQCKVTTEIVSKAECDRLAPQHAVHQGVVALCLRLPSYDEVDLIRLFEAFNSPKCFLILDGIQDPHNLGACLRSANAFGVHAVIVPKKKSVGLTSAARKVSTGADLLTPFIQVTNLSRTINWLKEQGVWLVGLDAAAKQSISDIDLRGDIALVMGSEGSGMRRLTTEHCDYVATIPMFGDVESLNVSVAAGVVMYEVIRQRQK